ncbi:hypothetical protein FACS1894172_20590 [Spirochaetia bacterium]|nr:hypothetical protein FACS1894172_20590 [Spirochaetia bacterium]
MNKIEIIPFQSAGKFILNENREKIISKINSTIRNTREETHGINNFIIDDFEDQLVYYNKSNNKLFYVLFSPSVNYELIFNGINLFVLNSGELYNFLKKLDNNLHTEDYVGFGSLKYGIDIYAPNFVEDNDSLVEAISIAIKGYFDCIYNGFGLNINELQNC